MTTGNNSPLSLQELIELLEVHGADQQRWPPDQRIAADELLLSDSDARELLAEAVALDRVLRLASVAAADSNTELAERIVAAAGKAPRAGDAAGDIDSKRHSIAAGDSNVIAWPGARQGVGRPRLDASKAANDGVSRGNPYRPMRQAGRSAAFLAASLVLGIYIGMNNGGSTVFQALAAAAGLSTPYEAEVSALDLGDVSGLDGEAL